MSCRPPPEVTEASVLGKRMLPLRVEHGEVRFLHPRCPLRALPPQGSAWSFRG